MSVPTKNHLCNLLNDIATNGDKEANQIAAIKQLCLMLGYNEQSETTIDFSKLKINFGKKSKK